jgi:predicted ribosomally synthesized peptide with SipW-like signal peptide
MNKKIISLLFLLILLVSVTVSYAYFSQSSTSDDHQTNTGGDIDDDSVSSEIDSTLLDEDQGVEIGDMI